MCGFVGLFEFKESLEFARARALDMAKTIRHRGPDWSGVYVNDRAVLAHERLSIVDVDHGAQPLIDSSARRVLAVNGEIYNHLALRQELKRAHPWTTNSDCEIILYLYDEYGPAVCKMLSGIFAFALFDERQNEFFIARDHLGIVPLYIGWGIDGTSYVASEMKALDDVCETIQEFPPGHYYTSRDRQFVKWYDPEWAHTVPERKVSLPALRAALDSAVKQQLMCDVPYGVLISGGLDSSLIAAIVAQHRFKRIETGEVEEAWWPRLHSFSVGLEGAPDMQYARKVAAHIGTVHHEIVFTIEEGLDALKDVIRHLETFDVTSIRAATPMYLMARRIKSMGIKMVLSGEGADEVFGGYLYFHMAPTAEEFHQETVRKLFALSKYDCCRANKATAAWGVETRVPFLDKDFLDYAMSIDPADKMCPGKRIEKYILREAFRDLLPEDVLWRQKEQFSDGVGYNWIDCLKQQAAQTVSDEMLARAADRFPKQTPTSKEGYLYRMIFDTIFKNPTACLTVPVGPSIACSSPAAFRWSQEFTKMDDPSGRAVKGIHVRAIDAI
ncbi:asparagine synthetase B [Bradyrhizobium sp. CCBAU 51745]|uniref:asparagine synthase B n=1 Tax=Bradyrhizobium sp. CCBAU 51745 TaxID=1325099 RepID=UPI0023061899|nr:asparagine synthase B [Bradyrhizobium sp. CCBAU 51745]MDA9444570.1 asparagine synthetase B [Bradyrhizobium sp. CCBAU 51745]